MAFAFFRRRQKLVIIIMAALMVAFLVGFQGMQQLVSRGAGKETLGTGRWGDVLHRDVESANSDIQLLSMMGLGRQQQFIGAVPTGAQFMSLIRNEGMDAALAYALLLDEAESEGLAVVTEDDVDQFFEAIGLTGAQYDRFVIELADRPGQGEELIRSAVARWLTIVTSFGNATVAMAPSEPELLHTFRDLNEEIDLLVGEFRAVDLTEEVTEQLDDERILSQYNEYRTRAEGTLDSPEDFGFGYRRPHRVGISWLFIDREMVERVARPTRAEVLEYWRENRDEFVEQVPAEGEDESQPVTRLMEFAESEPLIIEKLAPEIADRKTEDLLARADRMLQQIPMDAETNRYLQVRRRMVQPADSTLQRRLTVRIVREPLREVMDKIAMAADLDAICYPWGDMGDVSIDPEVEITLPVEQTSDATLGDVLELITAQLLDEESDPRDAANGPRLNWVHCAELETALFVFGGELETFPIEAGRTELLSINELLSDPVLGNAYTSQERGEGLWNRAFDVQAFRQAEGGTMSEGDIGPRMFVRGPRTGRLLWRLTQVSPAHDSPQAEVVADIPADLLENVRRDLKLVAAMRIARQRADDVLADLSEGGELEQMLRQSDARVFQTGMFSRKTYGLQWRGIPQMRVGNPDVMRYMVNQAFELAPDEPSADAAADEPSEPKLLELPPRRSVSVLHRVGYSPASQAEFEQVRAQLALMLMRNRFFTASIEWFDSDNVIRRTEFRFTDQGS